MHDPIGILAPYYFVGEQEWDVESLTNKTEVLGEYGMPDIKDLWGWGYYRKTQKSRIDLARATAMGTLTKSGLQPADVDALILCCCDGLNYHGQNQFLGELSSGLGLVNYSFFTWVGGAGCASLFSAVEIARSLVLGGSCENVLVVTVDKIDDDAERFQRFGVLSDGACSFIVSRCGAIDFAILGTKVLSCPESLRNGGQEFQQKCQLIYAVFDELHAHTSQPSGVKAAYLGSNVFIPIQELEMSVMPMDGLLAYQKNTARYGHCYAADPVINLLDFYADETNRAVKNSVMASTAHGHFGVILLERRGI
jgi:3-oxoacyl-[acyl-carrier-protein] synthase-3